MAKYIKTEDGYKLITELDDYRQSDWDQADKTQIDYIKNKPILGALAKKDKVQETDLSTDIQEALNKNNIYIGSGEMPDGSLLQIDPTASSPSVLPIVSEKDNGKVLRVVGGKWVATTILNAEGVGF